MTKDPATTTRIRQRVAELMPEIRDALERLVRIPSVSFPEFDPANVRRSGEFTRELLDAAGLQTEILEVKGAHPAVIGRRPAPPGAPTVLLYAHHDVQPVGDLSQWQSDPFEPVERDGRLYGRGAADDKAGVMAHVAALRAFGDSLPVGVVVFVEGEEEFGSESLDELLAAHAETLRSDVIVIADSGNWDIGQPALTPSLRGLVTCFAEARV